MTQDITIIKKTAKKGDDGHKIVSVRMEEDLVKRLDELSVEANRSRNELINLLLKSALEITRVVE